MSKVDVKSNNASVGKEIGPYGQTGSLKNPHFDYCDGRSALDEGPKVLCV